ncbi:MAG: NAD-dependent epimerase/dehydratase family protein, partial [Fermentimonas sp.]
MKILVTGAAGFIGFHLAKRLLDEGHDVFGIDNLNDYYDTDLKFGRLDELGVNREDINCDGYSISEKYSNFIFIKMDLTEKEKLDNLFEEEMFDVVVNLAAQAGVRYSIINPGAYIESNLVGFFNILEACRHWPVKHLVYASSSSVYGANTKIPYSESDKTDSPVSLYAATKKSNELMAYAYSHLYKIPATGLRFFTVYGPWGRPDMAPSLFMSAILKGETIKLFNSGEMERDFTYIDDIIEGIIKVIS